MTGRIALQSLYLFFCKSLSKFVSKSDELTPLLGTIGAFLFQCLKRLILLHYMVNIFTQKQICKPRVAFQNTTAMFLTMI